MSGRGRMNRKGDERRGRMSREEGRAERKDEQRVRMSGEEDEQRGWQSREEG